MSTPGVMGDGAQLALARSLVQALENGDQARAAGVLARLGAEREAELFRQVGRLTRALHDALRDTRLQSRLADLAAQDLPDARERLAQAAGRSEDAARRVGAVLDAMLVRACELERRMRARIDAPDAAGSAAQDAEPAQWEAIRACASRLQADLAEMRLLQDVQDTGGQVLRTVLQLVQEVEDALVRVLRQGQEAPDGAGASRSGSATVVELRGGDAAAGAPRHPLQVVRSGDEIEDLLAGLGL